SLAPGDAGRYVRSNGTIWQAGSFVSSDIPDGTVDPVKLTGLDSLAYDSLITAGGFGFSPRRIFDSASTDPGAEDDSTEGYRIFSLWLNTSSGALFMCVDSSSGAAVWRQIYPQSPDLSSPGPIGDVTP